MIRTRLAITGVVQGVGFRPCAWRLATRLGLSGFVENTAGGVVIEVQGPADAVAGFLAALPAAAPPLASIERIATGEMPPRIGEAAGFRILATASRDGPRGLVPPDVATCDACLAELRDGRDRRHGHPFVTCTDCGPRFTIIESLPYDRETTTMRAFPACPRCAAEYGDPADRRFHAESISCPACGPRLWFMATADAGVGGRPRPAPEAAAEIDRARSLLAAGGILAVKNLGGFQLACDATDAGAVGRLRGRKRRPAKPLAVLVAGLDAARRIAVLDDQEARLLTGPERPIVLVRGRADGGLAAAVAPGSGLLGLMLPAAPLQHLLCQGLPPLVTTSGNLAEEPIVAGNAAAAERLREIADGFLFHDLDIHTACDDSVVRCVAGATLPIRRSRGFAPLPVRLAAGGPTVLAVGGDLKAALCLAVDDRAILGQHVGDTGSLETLAALERSAEHLLRLFAAAPDAVAADLHPGSLSAAWAARFAAARGIPLVRVQHHEAHVAALLAEHCGGSSPPATIGRFLVACFDGTGYRPDGSIAGGEFFLASHHGIQHVANLAPFPLPGGDAAIRHPWRTALAVLHAAGIAWDDRLAPVRAAGGAAGLRLLRRQLDRRLVCPSTTSMGRLFDAVAALAGGPADVTFEAEAALALESWAAREAAPDDGRYAFDLSSAAADGRLVIDWRPVVAAVVRDLLGGEPVTRIAAAFHDAVARMIEAVRARIAPRDAAVGLTGGVFQNAVLVERALPRLRTAGCDVLLHHAVPPNDGGLALGQALLARDRIPPPVTPA